VLAGAVEATDQGEEHRTIGMPRRFPRGANRFHIEVVHFDGRFGAYEVGLRLHRHGKRRAQSNRAGLVQRQRG
jgi:hypothetical protein